MMLGLLTIKATLAEPAYVVSSFLRDLLSLHNDECIQMPVGRDGPKTRRFQFDNCFVGCLLRVQLHCLKRLLVTIAKSIMYILFEMT